MESIAQHSNIPASDIELEQNQPFKFTISGYEFYKFRMQGLPLPDYYEVSKILKISIYSVLYNHYSKELLKVIIDKAMEQLDTTQPVVHLVDLVYKRVIPIPLVVSILCLLKHNFKYWRYPYKWIWKMTGFFRENIDARDLPELADRFMMYTIDVKKKLEIILRESTGSTINTMADSKTSKPSRHPDCAQDFLSAGQQVLGRRAA